MTTKPFYIHGLSTLLALSLFACGGGDQDADLLDGGSNPEGSSDGNTAVDAGMAAGCSSVRQLDRYPWGISSGAYNGTGQSAPPNDFTLGLITSDLNVTNRLVALARFGGGLQVPTEVAFTETDNLGNCHGCVTMSEGCSGGDCQTVFFAQGGTLEILRADKDPFGGVSFRVHNLFLREWSLNQDQPKAGGKCVQIATADIDWLATSPACSGDLCETGAGCCNEAPHCTGGSPNLTFCTSSCGGGFDGCSANSDCCEGFACSGSGRCEATSCEADSCGGGFDVGAGCCGAAPYCVQGACAEVCGASGSGCGSSADCCTGFSCEAGVCS